MHQNKNTACQNKKHSGFYISKQNHKSCAYFGRLHKKNSTEFIIAKATFRYLFFFTFTNSSEQEIRHFYNT